MFVYLGMYAVVAIGALLRLPNPDPRRKLGALSVVLFAFCLLIGLRYEVGGDWQNYQYIFQWAARQKLSYVLTQNETLYQLLNWSVAVSGIEVWLVNLTCSSVFAFGLAAFARRQPDPWLVVAAAVPYLIVVVAMGYSRQAVAIGLLMLGLADFFKRRSALRFAAFIVAAALFHRTAVVAFPIVAIASSRSRVVNAVIVVAASYLLYDLFLDDAMSGYVRNYVDAGYSSQGAAIRLAMSAVAAVIVLLASDRLGLEGLERSVWRNFAFVTLGLGVLLGISPSSTAVDRIALYMLPMQIAVFGRVPALFREWRTGRYVVLLLEAALLIGWLTFAAHAEYWLPYQFYPF